MPPAPPETTDVEQGTPQEAPLPQRPSSVPSFLFISFVLWMIMNNQADDLAARATWQDNLSAIHDNIQNYSAWLNGSVSNFSMPTVDSTLIPLVMDFMSLSGELDSHQGSYYQNLTAFWKGDVRFHNLTNITTVPQLQTPFWLKDAEAFVSTANLTNATELSDRLGKWQWAHSTKTSIRFADKKVSGEDAKKKDLSEDIALIHGKIDLSDPDSSEEMRLELEGVHFISNGSIYAFAETARQGIDTRYIPGLVPEWRLNDTARIIEAELFTREAIIKERLNSGSIEDAPEEDNPITGCSFKFFGQILASGVPLYLMQELEEEIDNPTGITTVRAPEMKLSGVLVSKNCGILYELPDIQGLKSHGLFRRITTYGGLSAFVNMFILWLLLRQISLSRSAAGLSRVSRYPFIIQSMIDAMSFIGHVTIAILSEGRTSVAVLAPAGIACVLFVYEAQFAVLVGQIQAPEDVIPTPPRPTLPPAPRSTPPPQPQIISDEDAQPQANAEPISVVVTTVPPPTPTTQPPIRPSLARFLWDHIRTDPSARMWALMSFFLVVVFRLVIALSIPLVFLAALHCSIWLTQIYRAARRGRTSGLTAEYLIGTTLGRLYFLLYFLGCPENVLDIEQRPWVYGVAIFMLAQAAVIILQGYFGPSLFLPRRLTTADVYDYHPPLPLPDPEAPEQSLGDCSICMDAIEVDPALRGRMDEKGDGHGHGLSRHTTNLWAQNARKTYSLAPCHHLFHTACLERWLAIKNICPQCRRPLPPL
ncbi:hypothetical protein BDY19DRAFT_975766 [Irpex rosettiformis]|uniref:Uncharacterized protein n=1 Tax=Irpex rosettiformis TaxID=378272 RepID=A0ACB8TP06_9APHY|nr:hypothetical protein BDY19DRAFT_975766 [Irpex rosettiformis]